MSKINIPDKLDMFFKEAYDKHLNPVGFPDWVWLKAQGWEESRFNYVAESPVGAVGVMQFMPATWKEWAPKAGYTIHTPRTYPEASIMVGAKYMAWLWNQWKSPRPMLDRMYLTLASYNSGIGYWVEAQKRSGMKNLYSEIAVFIPEVNPKGSKENLAYPGKIEKTYRILTS